MVAATFLIPPLDFDQTDHTGPSLRHHGSIFIVRFRHAAANSSEMSRRPQTERQRARDGNDSEMNFVRIYQFLFSSNASTTAYQEVKLAYVNKREQAEARPSR